MSDPLVFFVDSDEPDFDFDPNDIIVGPPEEWY